MPIKHFLWHLSPLATRPELDRVLPMWNTSRPVYTCTWHMHSFFSWLVREVTIWTRITVVRHLAGSLLGSHDYRRTNEMHGRCSRMERLRLVPQLLIDSWIVSPQRRNREGNQTFSAVQAVSRITCCLQLQMFLLRSSSTRSLSLSLYSPA